MTKTRLIVTTILVGVSLLSGNRALAQDPSDEDINLFRKDVRSLKEQIIAANMDLTDNEAQQFWPIYDRYTAELVAITDAKYALLKEYAQNHNPARFEGPFRPWRLEHLAPRPVPARCAPHLEDRVVGTRDIFEDNAYKAAVKAGFSNN